MIIVDKINSDVKTVNPTLLSMLLLTILIDIYICSFLFLLCYSLVSQRNNLKAMLVDQLRSFLFRPNLVDRAKYYSIVLLSSVPLTKTSGREKTADEWEGDKVDESTASISAILFKVYLSFFRASVEADELPERLTTALLTGISRVAPYLSGNIFLVPPDCKIK